MLQCCFQPLARQTRVDELVTLEIYRLTPAGKRCHSPSIQSLRTGGWWFSALFPFISTCSALLTYGSVSLRCVPYHLFAYPSQAFIWAIQYRSGYCRTMQNRTQRYRSAQTCLSFPSTASSQIYICRWRQHDTCLHFKTRPVYI